MLKVFVKGNGIIARQDPESDEKAYLTATETCTATVTIITNGQTQSSTLTLPAGKEVHVFAEDGTVTTNVKSTKNSPFVAGGTYTLSGVRVAEKKPLPRGIYIQNGKKMVR